MTKVSSLPVATAMDDTDQFVIQDNGITKRINMSAIKSNFTSGSTVDGDLLKFKKVITATENITGVGANNTIKVTVLKTGSTYESSQILAGSYHYANGSQTWKEISIKVPTKIGSTASAYTTGPSGGVGEVMLSNSDGSASNFAFNREGLRFTVYVPTGAQYEVAVYGA